MVRTTDLEDRNLYYQRRVELGLTREKASELLEVIPPERIERIENEKFDPHPEEVLLMAEKYKMPELYNYYCTHQCPIGAKYIPEIKVKDLSRIVLEMLVSLNSIHEKKERLMEIAADGMVANDELQDFLFIQNELEKISITVDTLQLWVEKMKTEGLIDLEQYSRLREEEK
ncbi:MAG: helix-turn-helix transcriptional regulator [Lachnospiraceae bacterium]|nr:helix-turn-helix transcriptional regulator [Lachnospiraceae bacterium]